MYIEIGTNLSIAILAIVCGAVALAYFSNGRIGRHAAQAAMWTTWGRVSEQAIEAGKDCPPPPLEHGRR